ncbi:MAG TPA: Gfo/Idh/MocA family oxidoreductase [Candidatus Hydrogenedentes bacterium]|nr:Gfo/Idh/MocA family oxidoreductase [Candidatus Hydrogenedentota bacterium]HNT87693.1 Gfo/Idh/MocA family oxidoreductase [Candidatus Hydrogenedentota bacterium]
MSKLGVGIIGCGWVGEEYIKAFQNDARSEVRALVNPSLARPEMYKAKHGLNCTVGSDADAILPRDDIDIVVVATPHDRHTPYVVAAAAAGKHLVIEKPVALTPEDVRRQQDAVREADVKSVVSFVLHWNPLLMTVDRLIERGAFGNVFLVEVDYLHRIWCGPDRWLGSAKQGGTSILVGGCHAVDALRWFARSEAVEVTAYQTKTENPNEYPGTITAIVKFANGAIGRVTSSFDAQMPYVFHIGVYGTEGSIRNDKVYAPKLFPGQNGFMTIPCVLPDSGDVAHHPFQGEASHLLDCILEDRRPFPDLDDAVKTMDICFAADASAAQGRPVALASA